MASPLSGWQNLRIRRSLPFVLPIREYTINYELVFNPSFCFPMSSWEHAIHLPKSRRDYYRHFWAQRDVGLRPHQGASLLLQGTLLSQYSTLMPLDQPMEDMWALLPSQLSFFINSSFSSIPIFQGRFYHLNLNCRWNLIEEREGLISKSISFHLIFTSVSLIPKPLLFTAGLKTWSFQTNSAHSRNFLSRVIGKEISADASLIHLYYKLMWLLIMIVCLLFCVDLRE